MSDKLYQIYRTKKLSTMGNVSASGGHMSRSTPTPNADPSVKNRIIVGSADPTRDVSRLLPKKGARDSEGKLLRTERSVLAIEVMVTTTAEWWDKSTPEMEEDWVRQSCRQLARQYGKENIAHLQVHYDEKTPHITGFIVPLDKDGKLNAKSFLGTRAKLRKMQTDMAKVVEHLGLERGVEGSKATHQRVQRHYGQIKRKPRAIKIDAPTFMDFLKPSEYADRQKAKAEKQAAGLFAKAKTVDSAVAKAKGATATATKLAEQNKRLERDLDKERQRAEAAELRALALPDVAAALGLEQDPKDRTQWRSATGMKIGITGSKFYDNTAKTGGGGAIDLTKHCLDTDYRGALSWLAANFGSSAVSQDIALREVKKAKRDVSRAVQNRRPFNPPAPVDANWPAVRAYLIERRKLPAETIDAMHKDRLIYADDRRNAVFVTTDDKGRPTGAELKGTGDRPFSGMAVGSMKAHGAFRLGQLTAKVAYLVESAIDAVSLFTLRRRAGERDFCVVSAAGSSPTPPLGITGALSAATQRVCAYDADKAGDKAARSMSGWSRLRPDVDGADWNQILMADDQEQPRAVTRHRPSPPEPDEPAPAPKM